MMRVFRPLPSDCTGAAAAEMALILPLLLVLMVGPLEIGNYFLSEHVVDKAVRDAARYAARQPVDAFDCADGQMNDPSAVQKIARTGDPAGGDQRLRDWTSDSMTTVSVTCDDSGTYTGIYADFPDGVPVVTVSATVPYTAVLGVFGVRGLSLTLHAEQQAAVMGE
jgi:Flp pilus assembly protein TadG